MIMIVEKIKVMPTIKVRCLCCSLREWILLLSIIFFIFTAIFTILSIMGFSKSERGWQLILADILEEEEKSQGHPCSDHQESSNEQILCHSVQSELMKTCIFYVCAWTGVLNMCTVACLLVGVIKGLPGCILPWLIVSLTTYCAPVFTFFLIYFCDLDTINPLTYVMGAASTLVFFALWYTIYYYFCGLMVNNWENGDYYGEDSVTQIIKAYGGCTHTIKTIQKSESNQTI